MKCPHGEHQFTTTWPTFENADTYGANTTRCDVCKKAVRVCPIRSFRLEQTYTSCGKEDDWGQTCKPKETPT